jgi:hypothetical protein
MPSPPASDSSRERAESQRDGGGPVVVDPCTDRGEDDKKYTGDAREDAGQAVHVVARIGGPGDEREQRRQDAAADESRGARQVAAPQGAFTGDRGCDRL